MTSEATIDSSPRRGGARKWLGGGAIAVLLWFAGAELITAFWYGSQESKMKPNPLPDSGEIVLSRLEKAISGTGAAGTEKGIGDAAMEMLKCSFGRTLYWNGNSGPAAVTILKWPDKSVVSGVESMHNPGNCLKASGWEIGKRTEYGVERFGPVSADVTQWEVARAGTRMMAYSAVFRRFADRSVEKTPGFWSGKRLQPVLDGRRDAPVFIILAYLPLGSDGNDTAVHSRFVELMRSIFDIPAVATR